MPDFTSFQQKLSDLEFLRRKALDGDLIIVNGQRNRDSAGVITSFVPALGKTFHLLGGQINSENAANTVVSLINDVNVKDIIRLSTSTLNQFKFIITSDILVGDGIKDYSIEITNAGTAGAVPVYATMIGWIEDT